MAERRAFIFGAGGHARVVASLLPAAEVTFIVGDPAAERQLAEDRFFAEIDAYRAVDVYLGIGANAARRRVLDRLRAAGVTPATCVAPTAFVARTASLGAGVVICPGSAVMAGARLGDAVIVNTLSGVDHDCVVGDDTQITVGVTLAGEVTLGRNCFLGMKSAVFPRVAIGDNVVVMAGALVTKPVAANSMVGGSPARRVRSL